MPGAGLLAAVAEHGLHLDAGRHVHHRAGFGDGALARIELDLDELHVLAEDLEVDVVRAASGRGAERRRSGAAPASDAAANCGTALSGVQFVMPAVNTSVFASMLPLTRFGHDLVLADGTHLVAADRHVPLACH